MSLAFSLVTFTSSEDVGSRQTAVLPTTLLPQPARMIGGASTMKWMIGDDCLETYVIRVVHQADDIAVLHRAEQRWNATHHLVLASADEGARQPVAPGRKILRGSIVDNSATLTDSAVLSANAVTAAVPDAIQEEVPGTEAVSGHSSEWPRSTDVVEKLFLLLAEQAPEDILVVLRNLVSVLKSQGHIAKQFQDVCAVCETLVTKVCVLQDANSFRCENLMQLDDLPDEMLLKVFSFLPPDDLLRSVRSVGRRWRRLALDSSVWKHCRYSLENLDTDQHYDWRSLRLALRLAPCLHTLELDPNHYPTDFDPDDTFDLEEDVKSVMRLIGANTKCAVANVFLNITGCIDAGWAAVMLKRQVSLGRLRCVHITFNREGIVPQSDVSLILLALERCDLVEVRVSNFSMGPLQPPESQQLPEEQRLLKRLSYYSGLGGDELEPLLEHLLKLHGPGLEHVNLGGYVLAVPLLSQHCSNLKEACVPSHCNLEPLLQCSSLSCLRLSVKEAPSREAITYLQGATGLTSMAIVLEDLKYFSCTETLVEALASSGESLLERLCIDVSVPLDVFLEFDVLSLPLAGLPRLERLDTTYLSYDFCLDNITPTTTPSLRVLHFFRQTELCCYSTYFCFLSYVRRLLRRLPLLHVTGLLASHRCTAWGTCACCLKGEHRGKLGKSVLPSGFYAHDASHRCGLHESSFNWMWMDCRGRSDSSSSEGDQTDQDKESEGLDSIVEDEECTASEYDELEDESEEVEGEDEVAGEEDL